MINIRGILLHRQSRILIFETEERFSFVTVFQKLKNIAVCNKSINLQLCFHFF